MIAVSKSCCPVCWDIITIFNKQAKTTQEQARSDSESGNHTPPVTFKTRGRHPNLYPVDLPLILDEGIKDELLRKFSTNLLNDLLALWESSNRTTGKHVPSTSNVSQPESVALSLNSSLGGSVDHTEADAEDVENFHRETFSRSRYDVELWDKRNCSGYDLDQPERSK
jgi:hypothetical protein